MIGDSTHMLIDLTAVTFAVDKLEARASCYGVDPQDLMLRDALIYRFNAAYRQICISLNCALNTHLGEQLQAEQLSFASMIKCTIDRGYAGGTFHDWIDHRQTRRLAAKAYDDVKASQTVARIPKFIQDAKDTVLCLALV